MSDDGCVCPSDDAERCYDLRYYGHSPATLEREREEDEDACHCSCHMYDEEGEDDLDIVGPFGSSYF